MTDIYIGIKEDDSTAVSSPVPVSHNDLQDVGSNTHPQIDTHIADMSTHFLKSTLTKDDVGLDQVDNTADADKPIVAAQLVHNNDATKHFTQAQIDHMAIINVGNIDHGGIDMHIGNAALHFIIDDAAPGLDKVWSSTKTQTEINLITGVTDHTLLTNIGVKTHPVIDTELAAASAHAADGTLHFTKAAISHTEILDKGTNTHPQIDTHIADTTTHFLASTITPATLGLGNVDNTADADKPVSTATTTAITVVDDKVTANLALANAHRIDASIHYQIDDLQTQTSSAWSSTKIQAELDGIDVSGIAKLDVAKAYIAGDLVINNGNIYEANGAIPAGAMFNIGTTGPTWSALLSGDAVDLDVDLTTVYAGVVSPYNPTAVFVAIPWANIDVQNRPAELSINVAGDTITAVEGGLYNIDAVISLNGLSASTNASLIRIMINGVQHGDASPVPRMGNGENGIGVISGAFDLPTGATVQIEIRTFSGITQVQSNGTHIRVQKASGVKGDQGDAGTGGVTQAALDVVQADVDLNQVATDNHNNTSVIHFTQNLIDHTVIQMRGTNTHAEIDSHLANGAEHFSVSTIDHNSIQNRGTTSHADIDTHIADTVKHLVVNGDDQFEFSKALKIPKGTAAAPGLLFDSFTNAGITMPGDGEMDIVFLGQKKLGITSTGGLVIGSALGAPVDGIAATKGVLINGIAINLGHLANVDFTTAPVPGDQLTYDGANWIPKKHYHDFYRQPDVFVSTGGSTTQTHSSKTFTLPEAGDYEITLSYRYTLNDNAGDIVLRLSAAGRGLGVQGSDEFFYNRVELVDVLGSPRLTTVPSLGTNQELSAMYQDTFTLAAGPLVLNFLTRTSSSTAAYGIWGYHLKILKVD